MPVDLVTTSASGLDPDISPAAADFSDSASGKATRNFEDQVKQLVQEHTQSRQLSFLGEPRVNVLELNLDLDANFPQKMKQQTCDRFAARTQKDRVYMMLRIELGRRVGNG